MKGGDMGIESLKTIIGRAIAEPEYRELLFSDPDKALEGYELSDEEAAALRGLERDRFDAVASELEERMSRSGLAADLIMRKRPGIEPMEPSRPLEEITEEILPGLLDVGR
jgi:hypothetical protein